MNLQPVSIPALNTPYQPPDPPHPGQLPEPGNLPPGSYLPRLHSNTFVGREADLLALAEAMLTNQQDNIPTPGIVIQGESGIGKTHLAVEFCIRFGRFFHGVHWLRADLDLALEVANSGEMMGVYDWEDKLTDKVTGTLQAWKSGKTRLVVLDNVEDPAVLLEWLPQMGETRFLVTSRIDQWQPKLNLQQYRLATFKNQDSRLLLQTLAPRLEKSDPAQLDEIAETLHNLPLSLELAGRYLADRYRLSAAGYLKALTKAKTQLEDLGFADWLAQSSQDAGSGFLAATLLCWQRLQNDPVGADARQIFNICGYCMTDLPVPWNLIAETLTARTIAAQQRINQSIERLYRLGLLYEYDIDPAIHPLIGAFAQQLNDPDKENTLRPLAKTLANLAYQANHSNIPEQMRSIRQHLPQLAAAAENAKLEWAGNLWNELGIHFEELSAYGNAQVSYSQALRADEIIYNNNHPNIARDASNLGRILRIQGDLNGALYLFERALEINEIVFGPNHPHIAQDADNLGSVLHMLGRLQEAQDCYERALKLEEAQGSDHSMLSTRLKNLGSILRARGNLQQARDCYERALQIDEKIHGVEHPELARDASNLGAILRSMGDLKGAQNCYELALRIWEKALGSQHPMLAVAINNLGSVMEEQGNLEGAHTCYNWGLKIDETFYGSNHPNTSLRINSLGSIERQLGNLTEAKALYERALNIDQQIYGTDHPTVGRDLNNLGMVLKDLGNLEEAKTCYQKALAILEKEFSQQHPNVASAVNNLGGVLEDMGDLKGARRCYERALSILEEALSEDHPDVALAVNNLGSVMEELGELEGARQHYARALNIWEKTLGSQHPYVASAVNNLGSILWAQGDLAKAQEYFERALQIDEAVFGEEHPLVATRVNNLGGVLRSLGKYQEARTCFERALHIFEQFLPTGHPNLELVSRNLETVSSMPSEDHLTSDTGNHNTDS